MRQTWDKNTSHNYEENANDTKIEWNDQKYNNPNYKLGFENYMGAVGSIMMTIEDENDNGIVDADETTRVEDDGTKQVGDARIYGIDIQTSTIITNKDKLDFSLSYIRKYFKHLLFDYEPQTNWMGVPDVDYSGKDMALAPHWTINGTYSHNFTLWNGGILTARFEARYQSKYTVNWAAKSINWSTDSETGEYIVTIADTTATRFQEAYHIENVSLVYSHPKGNWSLTGYVNNLSNYAVKRSMMMNTMMIGSPRTYGGVLSVRF